MKRALYIILLMSVFLASCSEDADFSSNPSLHLEFSSDTVSFDTLFTEVNSPKAMFVVRNRNNNALRISDVRLASGGESGFSVLVDGQYGALMRDLEIRAKDSIFVLVSVSLDRNGEELPLMVRDSLLFTLESGVQQQVILEACGRDVTFLRAHTFLSDTVLSPGHYVIYDSLVVAEGATLGVKAATVLYFHDKAYMKVEGTLNAEGVQDAPVVFRGDRTDRMFPYLPYDRIPGQWDGITFAPTSNGNSLKHCDIHSANYGIRVERGDTSLQRISIESSKVCNFHGNALELVQAKAVACNSLFANAQGNCVKVVGGDVSFIHCTIANFYVWRQRDVALALHNSINGEPAPLNGAFFANCVIAGTKEDEIMGYLTSFGDSIPNASNYCFENSFVNTIDEGNENFYGVVYDSLNVAPFGKDHFRCIDNDNFLYDFHLTVEAKARGVASDRYIEVLRFDMDGVERKPGSVDAGCYQYVEETAGE